MSDEERHSLKIMTWNVNGIRSLYKNARAVKEGLDALNADIICFQETKVARASLDQHTALVDGYNSYYGFPRSKSGYSGVATYCKDSVTPFRAEEGLSGLFASSDSNDSVGFYGNIRAEFSKRELKELDFEGRAVITQHKIKINSTEQTLTLINVYCPRAEEGNEERLQIKVRFYHLLEVRTKALLESGSHVIIVGDFNTAHKPIDHCDPSDMEQFIKNPGREWMDKIIYNPTTDDSSVVIPNEKEGLCLIDAFRYLNPFEEKAFTCWCTQMNARSTNFGTRLDYILMNNKLVCEMQDCIILRDIQGSDHCPVEVIMEFEVIGAEKCPSFCTKNYPEFSGVQKKLSDFFNKKSSEQDLTSSTDEDFVGTSSSGTKRKETVAKQANPKKAKSDGKKQKKISSFFKSQLSTTQVISCPMGSDLEESSESKSGQESVSSSLSSLSELSPDDDVEPLFSTLSNACIEEENAIEPSFDEISNSLKEAGNESSIEAWRSMFSGPKPPPKCHHKEACVIRRVKKKGSNTGCMFWVCARGIGLAGDPAARCKYFQWASKR